MAKPSKKQEITQSQLSDRSVEAWEHSEAAAALKRLQENPRVKFIVFAAPANACPACNQLTGTYPKDKVPPLPYEACSHPLGCRAYYMPFIEEMYP